MLKTQLMIESRSKGENRTYLCGSSSEQYRMGKGEKH
jgi:hypothetical protein